MVIKDNFCTFVFYKTPSIVSLSITRLNIPLSPKVFYYSFSQVYFHHILLLNFNASILSQTDHLSLGILHCSAELQLNNSSLLVFIFKYRRSLTHPRLPPGNERFVLPSSINGSGMTSLQPFLS